MRHFLCPSTVGEIHSSMFHWSCWWFSTYFSTSTLYPSSNPRRLISVGCRWDPCPLASGWLAQRGVRDGGQEESEAVFHQPLHAGCHGVAASLNLSTGQAGSPLLSTPLSRVLRIAPRSCPFNPPKNASQSLAGNTKLLPPLYKNCLN